MARRNKDIKGSKEAEHDWPVFRPQPLAKVCMLMGQELITLMFIIAGRREMYLMDKWITDDR